MLSRISRITEGRKIEATEMAESQHTVLAYPSLQESELCSEDTVTGTASFAEDKDIILTGAVMVAGKAKILTLTTGGLHLQQPQSSKNSDLKLPWCEVINAETYGEGTDSRLNIHFMQQKKNKSLKHKCLTMTCKEVEPRKWVDAVQTQCQQVTGRPKNLFVVINRIGGSGNGHQTFQKSIGPLFKLAGCQTTVIVLERSKHALEIGEQKDFSSFDGIICVGGDGTFQELLQGYFLQLQRAAGLDINDKDSQFVKAKIPFCLMPTGTSNGMVRYTCDGVRECETSALRVIRGEIHPVSIMTVHESTRFVGICSLGMVSGFMTDVMKRADELRWMKKARYGYALATTMFKKRRKFSLSLEYLLAGHATEGADIQGAQKDAEKDREGGWVRYDNQGKAFAALSHLALAQLELEDCTVMNPYDVKGSTLVIDTGCSNVGFIKFGQTMTSGRKLREPVPNLELVQNVRGIRFKVICGAGEPGASMSRTQRVQQELEHYLFLDGEILRIDGLEVETRLLPGFVSMFGCIPSALRPTKKQP